MPEGDRDQLRPTMMTEQARNELLHAGLLARWSTDPRQDDRPAADHPYIHHASPEMTLRYAATVAATAEAEFLKHKKIGAHGVEIAISPADILDTTQLSQRTDRVLPNGVCLLPPLKSCDKGNAPLTELTGRAAWRVAV